MEDLEHERNSRGQSSTIDYILSDRAIHPAQILDVRSLTSANIGSDHFLVLCRLRIYIQKKRLSPSPEKEKWNIESLNDPQITETLIEYGTPAFLCFIDLTKAFDKVRLRDVIKILKAKHLPTPIIEIVKQLNTDTSTQISVNQHLIEEIRIQSQKIKPVSYYIVLTEAKGSKPVPIRLSHKMQKYVSCLINIRKTTEIDLYSNPYLFANPNSKDKWMSGTKAIRCLTESSGAIYPKNAVPPPFLLPYFELHQATQNVLFMDQTLKRYSLGSNYVRGMPDRQSVSSAMVQRNKAKSTSRHSKKQRGPNAEHQ
ncbi:hypothetical protein HUJ04_011340 [Dendroctonus ponderosae]|nr:hypothetical protein HUJ04_011340 [Dendroctonus ponderosae]